MISCSMALLKKNLSSTLRQTGRPLFRSWYSCCYDSLHDSLVTAYLVLVLSLQTVGQVSGVGEVEPVTVIEQLQELLQETLLQSFQIFGALFGGLLLPRDLYL